MLSSVVGMLYEAHREATFSSSSFASLISAGKGGIVSPSLHILLVRRSRTHC